MAEPQEITEARERVTALRKQVREEQGRRAVATSTAGTDAQLAALSEEERSLMAQLEEVRSLQMPGEVPPVVVPEGAFEGRVNVTGAPVRADEVPVPEGASFVEYVDSRGTLIRQTVNSETTDAVATDAPVDSDVEADDKVELTVEGAAADGPPAEDVAPAPAPSAVAPTVIDTGMREPVQPPPAAPADTTARSPKRR